jgi:outer membrane PBP1 activator LpoA protein
MAEYSISLQADEPGVAGGRRAVSARQRLRSLLRSGRLQPAVATAALLLAAVACTSPSQTQRAASPASVIAAQAADRRSAESSVPLQGPGSPQVTQAAHPRQVALLLPLSGRQQAAGIAVRDGFLAAALAQDASQRPAINLYDSAALGATTAYARAIADGAQFVVGPLTKEEVQAVADSGSVSIPTLALNYLPDNALPPGLLFQFALDPEDEARQVARRAVADGHTHGVALVPDNEWGQRLLRAFETEFAAAGGTLVGRTLYDTAARDYSQPITRLLLIDQSRTRANALAASLGTRMEFEPRARSDVQFVFVGAQPLQGRSLRPALRFHLTQDLPVYATSDVFELDSDANADLDGVMFPDMPWIVAPDAAANNLKRSLAAYWPTRSRGRGRLYAFGYDAFQLIPSLRSAGVAAAPLGGLTGRLMVDGKGRVRRELDWAQVENGRPRAIAVIAGGNDPR